MYKLYVDDERRPPSVDWQLARTRAEFFEVLDAKGVPSLISMDWYLGYYEPNGLAIVEELFYRVQQGEYVLPSDFMIASHSSDCRGRRDIERYAHNAAVGKIDIKRLLIVGEKEVAGIVLQRMQGDCESMIGLDLTAGVGVIPLQKFLKDPQATGIVESKNLDYVLSQAKPFQHITVLRADSMAPVGDRSTWPEIGSVWRHHNGNQYVVHDYFNTSSTKLAYPVTISYVNTNNGEKYCRRLSDWGRSMTPLTDPKPEGNPS